MSKESRYVGRSVPNLADRGERGPEIQRSVKERNRSKDRATIDKYAQVCPNKIHARGFPLTYKQEETYEVGQEVYWQQPDSIDLSGPYLIADVRGNGKYTLCDGDDNPVNNGQEVDEEDLSPVYIT